MRLHQMPLADEVCRIAVTAEDGSQSGQRAIYADHIPPVSGFGCVATGDHTTAGRRAERLGGHRVPEGRASFDDAVQMGVLVFAFSR